MRPDYMVVHPMDWWWIVWYRFKDPWILYRRHVLREHDEVGGYNNELRYWAHQYAERRQDEATSPTAGDRAAAGSV